MSKRVHSESLLSRWGYEEKVAVLLGAPIGLSEGLGADFDPLASASLAEKVATGAGATALGALVFIASIKIGDHIERRRSIGASVDDFDSR